MALGTCQLFLQVQLEGSLGQGAGSSQRVQCSHFQTKSSVQLVSRLRKECGSGAGAGEASPARLSRPGAGWV
ncbi:hypothetical protein D623_10000869 [Myotis brandtii]|uniref:Uncharacterized protein n=1 Tax=Myotis brandtii TaxID=109478 RepID=S7MW75_MYOBR|nr:hypothetical protein D623_10000869 [Myotis brandtii]